MISKNINENIKYIKNKFGNSSDIKYRTIKNITYIYLESVSSGELISEYLIKSILNNKEIYNSSLSILTTMEEILYNLSSGFTIVFIKNKVISIETKSILDRGITESTSETIIRGPKDSFTENHQINIGLIRKRIKDPNLWFKEFKIGKRTKTKV